LTELVAVVGIVAILAALAPSLRIDREQAGVPLHRVVCRFNGAQRAVTRNANVTLSPKAGGWQNGWQVTMPLTF
jgi:Tfp pilus assembly protein FimT